MLFSFYFASHTPNSQKDLEKTVQHFCKSIRDFAPSYTLDKVYATESGEIFAVKIDCAPPSRMPPEEETELLEALGRRLLAEALTRRFIPLDSEGNEIYLTPPYGFDVIFYHAAGSREEELQKLVIALANEMPGHEGKFNIQTHRPEDEPGEYYLLAIRIQDYWSPEARHRLMLAFYFRLLMLAKNEGFEAVITGHKA